MPDEPVQPDPETEDDAQPDPEADDAQPDPEVDALPDLPAEMDTADEQMLRDLYATLEEARGTRAESAQSAADLRDVQSIVDRQNAIAAELLRRRDERVAVREGLAALAETPPTALPDPEPATVGAGMTAAAIARTRPRTPLDAPRPELTVTRPRAALTASLGIDSVAAGGQITLAQLGQAYDSAKRGSPGDTYLASLPAFEDMDGSLLPELLTADNGATRNTRLINETVEDWKNMVAGRPRTAAITDTATTNPCTPLDIIRDIPDNFSTAEPVRDIFPSRPAGRMGFQYVPSIGLASVASGVDLWDASQQTAVNQDSEATWKPCVEVDCPSVLSTTVDLVVACLKFTNMLEMSAPERIANFTNALTALRARTKEARILHRLDTLSLSYQFFGDYGALPAVIEALNTVLAQLTYADRMDESNYVLLVPPGAVEALYIDRANRGYNNDATGDILDYIKANVEGISRVVETLDASSGTEPGLPFPALTPITDPPTPVTVPYISGRTFRFRLVEPSAAIYAETGAVNVGVTRDAQLIRQNKAQYFAEEYFILAKHGPAPWAGVDVTLCADGSRAGLIDPGHCIAS